MSDDGPVMVALKTRKRKEQSMKEMTRKRYAKIRKAAAELYGTMPVMRIYTELADKFGLSDESIRQILRKNQKKAPKT